MTLEALIAYQRERGLGSVHVVDFDAEGFRLAHTDVERARGEKTPVCPFHVTLVELGEMPTDEPGVYVMVDHQVDAYSESYRPGEPPYDFESPALFAGRS